MHCLKNEQSLTLAWLNLKATEYLLTIEHSDNFKLINMQLGYISSMAANLRSLDHAFELDPRY